MKPPPAAVSKHASAPREKRERKPRPPAPVRAAPTSADEAREREIELRDRWADLRRRRDDMRAGGFEPTDHLLARVANAHRRYSGMVAIRKGFERIAKNTAWRERVESRTATKPAAQAIEIVLDPKAEEVRAAAMRRRQSHGLEVDPRTAAGQRELEAEDARRVALNGRRHPVKDRHDTLFHERRQDHTAARAVAAARFDEAYHAEHAGQFRSPDYLSTKVDSCVRPRAFGFGGSYSYPEMRKVVGDVDLVVLIKRIIQGMRWEGIARDTGQTERQAGIAYRDALQRIVDRFDMEKAP